MGQSEQSDCRAGASLYGGCESWEVLTYLKNCTIEGLGLYEDEKALGAVKRTEARDQKLVSDCGAFLQCKDLCYFPDIEAFPNIFYFF